MGLASRKNARTTGKNNTPTGKKTITNLGNFGSLSPYKSRTGDVLKTLRGIQDETEAIEYLKRVNPDVSMATWNFVRLANQGNKMEFYSDDKKSEKVKGIQDEWREFASRINSISNSGLDGLIDQLHYSGFLLGGMGVEVEVSKDRRDIIDVYPVKPQSLYWEVGIVDGRKTWIPYQMSGHKKIYLDKANANFFWVPTDPEIGDPRGTLTMSPALQAVDFQMQILQDLQAVLHHQGYPRNDISINMERMLQMCPPHIRNDSKKLNQWIQGQHSNIVAMMSNIEPDSDYIHFDDVTINMNSGANAGRSMDVRAITELVDTQVLNGLKQLGSFVNRTTGKTETWSTVEFKIMTQGIKSSQRASKRLMEEIARLWLRVKGIQAVPVFTHNVVDWESEKDKKEVALMNQEYYAKAQLMGWIDGDTAAQETMDREKSVGEPSENVRASLNKLGDDNVDISKYKGNGTNPETNSTD